MAVMAIPCVYQVLLQMAGPGELAEDPRRDPYKKLPFFLQSQSLTELPPVQVQLSAGLLDLALSPPPNPQPTLLWDVSLACLSQPCPFASPRRALVLSVKKNGGLVLCQDPLPSLPARTSSLLH